MIASKAEIKLTKKVLIDTTDLQAKSNIIKRCFLIKKKECLKLKETIEGLEINLKALSEEKRLETENQDLKKMSNELEPSMHYLEQILEDGHDNTLYLYDEREREYNNEAVKCIMNLTDLRVASQKVGPVIKEVAELCGKIPNQLPSRTTVDAIVDRKLSVAKKQISQTLPNKDCTTLYTDEIRKYGKTMQSYIVTDENQTSYVIGLRDMFNKSGKCTLDTFREILHDISSLGERAEQSQTEMLGFKF